MKSNTVRVLAAGVAVIAIGLYTQRRSSGTTIAPKSDSVGAAVDKGAKWLVSVQGKDGGWGQDGGETSYVRRGEHLESNGNDVANTAVAAEALLHAGGTPASREYHAALERAVTFILRHVEASPSEGLAVTDLNGTENPFRIFFRGDRMERHPNCPNVPAPGNAAGSKSHPALRRWLSPLL